MDFLAGDVNMRFKRFYASTDFSHLRYSIDLFLLHFSHRHTCISGSKDHFAPGQVLAPTFLFRNDKMGFLAGGVNTQSKVKTHPGL